MTDLLPTHVLVSAGIARARAADAFMYVRQRGDADRGTLLLLVNDLAGNRALHRQVWDGERRRFEQIASEYLPQKQGGEDKLEETIAREADFDCDLWIIEIEDRQARLFFDTIFHESAAF